MDVVIYALRTFMEAVWDVIKFAPYIAAVLVFEALATPLTIDHAQREVEAKKKSET